MCKADFIGYFTNFLFMIMKFSTNTFIRVDGQSDCSTNYVSKGAEIVFMVVTERLVTLKEVFRLQKPTHVHGRARI
jgi:hypothetical protein